MAGKLSSPSVPPWDGQRVFCQFYPISVPEIRVAEINAWCPAIFPLLTKWQESVAGDPYLPPVKLDERVLPDLRRAAGRLVASGGHPTISGAEQTMIAAVRPILPLFVPALVQVLTPPSKAEKSVSFQDIAPGHKILSAVLSQNRAVNTKSVKIAKNLAGDSGAER